MPASGRLYKSQFTDGETEKHRSIGPHPTVSQGKGQDQDLNSGPWKAALPTG